MNLQAVCTIISVKSVRIFVTTNLVQGMACNNLKLQHPILFDISYFSSCQCFVGPSSNFDSCAVCHDVCEFLEEKSSCYENCFKQHSFNSKLCEDCMSTVGEIAEAQALCQLVDDHPRLMQMALNPKRYGKKTLKFSIYYGLLGE